MFDNTSTSPGKLSVGEETVDGFTWQVYKSGFTSTSPGRLWHSVVDVLCATSVLSTLSSAYSPSSWFPLLWTCSLERSIFCCPRSLVWQELPSPHYSAFRLRLCSTELSFCPGVWNLMEWWVQRQRIDCHNVLYFYKRKGYNVRWEIFKYFARNP